MTNVFRKIPWRLYKAFIFVWFRIRTSVTFVRNGFKNKTILFYPTYPSVRYALFRIISHMGYNVTNDPERKHDLAIFWQDKTFRKPSKRLTKISESTQVINFDCRDISKRTVDRAMKQIFGYSCQVDPFTFTGSIAQKENLNGRHRIEIIAAPIAKRKKGFVYHKVLNNRTKGGDSVQDIRIPIFGNLIPFVYLRSRKMSERFQNIQRQVTVEETTRILSRDEIKKVTRFCKKIGLDYGELDCIRDRADGRLYIIDANTTPVGPSSVLTNNQTKTTLTKLANAFNVAFIDKNL